jgi:hypothetical protein
MFRKHPSAAGAPSLEEVRFAGPSIPSRSCCCPARPVVRVLMPPVAGRPHPVDLWLCGHHYRLSRQALCSAGAVAEDLAVPPVPDQASCAATAV